MRSGPIITPWLARPTLLLNQSRGMRWFKLGRHNQGLGFEVRAATRDCRPAAPFVRALLRVVRPSIGTLDTDGLVGGCKGLIDCLLPPGAPRWVPGGRGRWVVPPPNGCSVKPRGLPDIILDDGPHYRERRCRYSTSGTSKA